jgi:hypothetical protein
MTRVSWLEPAEEPVPHLGKEVHLKKMKTNATTQGVHSMKKTLLVIALVAIMVFAFASTAMAKNAGSAAAVGDGYVSWSTAVVVASGQAAQAAGPHSNYTVSTVKCAVCHSMHGAPANTWLLTKITAAQATGGGAAYVCAYCHGLGASAGAMIVSINQFSAVPNGNTPHSSICYQNCHAGVHGIGVSTYSLLAAKLLTNKADTIIADAIGANAANSGLTIADFTAPVGGFQVAGFPFGTAASTYPKTAMATGYLCGQVGCHTQSAFAVKVRGDNMLIQSRAGGPVAGGLLSGHPVVAAAATSFLFPTGSAQFGVAGVQVAYKPTAGCPTCHDLADAGTTLGYAFPHNKGNTNIWLTKASNASGSDSTIVQNSNVIDSSTGTIIGLADNYTTVQDGICLKCHVSADGLSGVGKTF